MRSSTSTITTRRRTTLSTKNPPLVLAPNPRISHTPNSTPELLDPVMRMEIRGPATDKVAVPEELMVTLDPATDPGAQMVIQDQAPDEATVSAEPNSKATPHESARAHLPTPLHRRYRAVEQHAMTSVLENRKKSDIDTTSLIVKVLLLWRGGTRLCGQGARGVQRMRVVRGRSSHGGW